MSGTVQTPSYLMTNEDMDNTTGQISPARIRNIIESLAAQPGTTQTASYTAAYVDRGTNIEMNAATALNFTVPPNTSVAFPIYAVLMVTQIGAGQVTLVPGSGVTIRTPSTLTTRAQWSTIGVRKRATDEWVAFGDLT